MRISKPAFVPVSFAYAAAIATDIPPVSAAIATALPYTPVFLGTANAPLSFTFLISSALTYVKISLSFGVKSASANSPPTFPVAILLTFVDEFHYYFEIDEELIGEDDLVAGFCC